ncbi:MAG TPA: hypothetical protein VMS11_04685 [Solirubrobacterales bacterium]|nr:hypothetical protein [Solirubrobacterales bacterium]
MSTPGDSIGALFSPHLIEEGVLSTLQRWLPLYLDAVKDQHGVELPEIASWGLVDEEPDRWPEQAYPALIVIAERTQSVENYAEGWYRATWPFQVVVYIQHPQRVWARKIAQLYGAVIRGAILQRKSLSDGGRDAEWTGEQLPFEAEQSRTLAASFNNFTIEQDEVVNWQAGPKDELPPNEPPGEGPEVKETAVEVEPLEAQ